MNHNLQLEGCSIEYRKTKTKVITTANQNKSEHCKEPIRSQTDLKRGKCSDQDTIGFRPDWLSGWSKFFKPIIEWGKAIPLHSPERVLDTT